jgi:hypothetical protein
MIGCRPGPGFDLPQSQTGEDFADHRMLFDEGAASHTGPESCGVAAAAPPPKRRQGCVQAKY